MEHKKSILLFLGPFSSKNKITPLPLPWLRYREYMKTLMIIVSANILIV